jgi:Uma2 family endonuclease
MTKATLPYARRFSYEDLKEMPDDGYRREIIGGSLIVTPAPAGRHQLAVARLLGLLSAAATPSTMALPAPYDWRLPGGDSVGPDVVVVRREDFDPDGPLPESATPLLVVEILSPSNPDHDRLIKRSLYESLGVPAYWIVEPVAPSLLSLRLEEGRYQVEAEVTGGEAKFATHWPYDLTVTLADLTR